MNKMNSSISLKDLLFNFYDKLNPHVYDDIYTTINMSARKDNNLSIRTIEYAIKEYSKQNNSKSIDIYGNKINIYESFINSKNSYSSWRKFEFYRRGDIINYQYPHMYNDDMFSRLKTTTGQLNMFKWLVENNILDFIRKNMVHIQEAMYKYNKKNKANITYPKRSIRVESDKNKKHKKISSNEETITITFL